MCNFDNGFILCTCVEPKPTIHNKNSRRYKRQVKATKTLEYTWTLKQYQGLQEYSMEGIYYFPESKIDGGLTADFVANNLNTQHCFDFDYTPKEGDALLIRSSENYTPYLAFIFKDNQWTEDHYSPFDSITETIFNGILKEKK